MALRLTLWQDTVIWQISNLARCQQSVSLLQRSWSILSSSYLLSSPTVTIFGSGNHLLASAVELISFLLHKKSIFLEEGVNLA